MMKTLKTRVAAVLVGLAASAPAFADTLVSVCDRTPAFKAFLTAETHKPCEQITLADLAAVTRVAVPGQNLAVFYPDDIANLPNVTILNITRNPYTALPPKAFAALPNLQTLVLFDTLLASLPADFLEGNPKIQNLHIFSNPFTTIPEPALARIEALADLQVLDLADILVQPVKDQLRAKFPDGGKVALTFY